MTGTVHAIHVGRRHDDAPFRCECGATFAQRGEAVEHLNAVAAPRSYPDVVTNPVDPPTVSGTDISVDVG